MITSEMDNVVTFLIGAPHPRKFVVHQNFVDYYCPLLKKAFNSPFIEGMTKTYKLEDTTPAAFALFVRWLYTQDIEDAMAANDHKEISAYYAALVRLWILAEKFMLSRLQNAVLEVLEKLRISTKSFPILQYEYVYEHTSNDSALRQLLVHQCVWHMASRLFKMGAFSFPPEMLIDIVTTSSLIVSRKGGTPPNILHNLHIRSEHDEDESNYAKTSP